MPKRDKNQPRLFDPKLGREVVLIRRDSATSATGAKRSASPKESRKPTAKRKRKTRSNSVWYIAAGLPETNRRRH
jgi:hypothetical protein